MPNDCVSGTAAPSNHHGRQANFARPTTTASPRRSRVRCTRGWAQTRHQTEQPPTAHLQKPNGSSGEQVTDGNKSRHHCTASCQRTQPTLPPWQTLITAAVFQFRPRLSPPPPACRLCLNPGHNCNGGVWPFRHFAFLPASGPSPPLPSSRLRRSLAFCPIKPRTAELPAVPNSRACATKPQP